MDDLVRLTVNTFALTIAIDNADSAKAGQFGMLNYNNG